MSSWKWKIIARKISRDWTRWRTWSIEWSQITVQCLTLRMTKAIKRNCIEWTKWTGRRKRISRTSWQDILNKTWKEKKNLYSNNTSLLFYGMKKGLEIQSFFCMVEIVLFFKKSQMSKVQLWIFIVLLFLVVIKFVFLWIEVNLTVTVHNAQYPRTYNDTFKISVENI